MANVPARVLAPGGACLRGVPGGGRARLMTDGGLRVVRPGAARGDAASGAMRREVAISLGTVGAERIWFGHVVLPPSMVSAVHHHGEAESGIFIVSGRARFLCGDGLQEVH